MIYKYPQLPPDGPSPEDRYVHSYFKDLTQLRLSYTFFNYCKQNGLSVWNPLNFYRWARVWAHSFSVHYYEINDRVVDHLDSPDAPDLPGAKTLPNCVLPRNPNAKPGPVISPPSLRHDLHAFFYKGIPQIIGWLIIIGFLLTVLHFIAPDHPWFRFL